MRYDGRSNLTPGRPTPPGGAAPTTSVRIPVELRHRLDIRAARDGVRPTTVILAALRSYLDDED